MKIRTIQTRNLALMLFAGLNLIACSRSISLDDEVIDPENDDLPVLFTETFDNGTLASKTWINQQSGNQNYAAIVNGALRHNLRTGLSGADPISGKLRSGLYSHTFLASNYYSPDTIGAITLEMRYRFDHSYWKTTAGDPSPIAAGKLFLSDTEYDSNGPYLGLTDYGTITLVSQNGPSDFNTWTTRTYGWKNANGTSRNNMYLRADTAVFKTDATWRTLSLEIQYNPDSIGYNKGRLKCDGVVLTDHAARNTDSLGWFNLPPEYVLKGFRIYASSVDITSGAEDFSTHPSIYSGYAGGFEVDSYTLYRGYKN